MGVRQKVLASSGYQSELHQTRKPKDRVLATLKQPLPLVAWTVTRVGGKGKPALRIAVLTRSRLSRTVASGNPTIVTPGRPPATSTSTETGIASTPKTAAALNRASTLVREQRPRQPEARNLERFEISVADSAIPGSWVIEKTATGASSAGW